MPETNGRTLEQMDEVFKDYSSIEELATKNRIFMETQQNRASS